MTTALRLRSFTIAVAAIVAGAGAYLYFARVESSTASTGAAADSAAQLQAVASIRKGAYVAFRDLRPGPTYGHLTFSSLENLSQRAGTTISCNRLHFSATDGLCLMISTAPVGFFGHLIDDQLNITQSINLPGMPSRARVARNGEFAAYTSFVAGDSYLAAGLSTRSRIVRMPSGEDVADLESFAVSRDGKEFYSIDFNFWGVTFTHDPNRIYATLGTGGRILLVEGDVTAREFRVIAEDIECPSLSPDEKHIAFKKRFGTGFDVWWQPAVIDLATMTVRQLPESRHIDDQIEWLDDGHILYAVGHSASATVRRADIWTIAIDGGSPSSIFLADAESPAVVSREDAGRADTRRADARR
jgi:hypothetical protein